MPGADQPQEPNASFRSDLTNARSVPTQAAEAPSDPRDRVAPDPQPTQAASSNPAPRGTVAKVIRWTWKAPLVAAGGVAALAVAAFVLLLVLGFALLAGGAVLRLPLFDLAAILGAAPVAVALGAVGRRLVPRVELHRGDVQASKPPRHLWRLVCLVPLTAAILGLAYGLYRLVYIAAQNHPAGALIVIGAAAVLGFVLMLVLARPREGAEWFDPDLGSVMRWPAIVLLVALALGAWAAEHERYNGTLNDYCRYGAVSRAQLGGCLDHVTTDRIGQLSTDAARFGRGELDSCLADSGPFCAAAKFNRDNAGD